MVRPGQAFGHHRDCGHAHRGSLGPRWRFGYHFGHTSLTFIACSLRRLVFGFRKTGSFSWISKLYQDIRNAITTSPLLALLMAPTAAVYALAYLYAAPRPPLGFDSLTYHLPIAANMIRTGGFEVFYFPHFFDLYSYLPANGDLFSVWVMLPFGCDFLLPWVNLPFLAMLSISAYKIAMDLHVPRPLAFVLSIALITPPLFLTTKTES